MTSHHNPLVSVVILNWNSLNYIHQCIESVFKQDYTNYEVIFVDNFSTDSSLVECKEKYHNINYIENSQNLGFAAGMNMGIKFCKGKYILLLNTDVYLNYNYLSETVKLLEQHPEVSCTASCEYKWNFPDLSNKKVWKGSLGIALHLRVLGAESAEDYTFGVSGSFPVYRTETVNEIIHLRGCFFDEKFGTGWEDTDLRFLFAFLDKKTMLCNTTKAWHIGSAADNGNIRMFDKNLGYQQRIFRNRLYVIGKYIQGNYHLWYWYICFINFVLELFIRLRYKESVIPLQRAKEEYAENKEMVKLENNIIRKNRKMKKSHIFKFVTKFY